jgi:hypothetical protein
MAMSDTPWGRSDDYERLIQAAGETRGVYFRTLGEPDTDVWMPIVNPAFQGGPAWPTRPAWQRIRTGDQTIIASSGLTDPFGDADEPNVGFAVETAVATTDPLPPDLRPSWLLELAIMISTHAAADDRFHLRRTRFGTFLFGVRGDSDLFRDWLDPTGTMGFLVGVPVSGVSTTIPLPAGTATLLVAKLLTPAEYGFVAARGPEGAQQLVALFGQSGTHHLSSLSRASVV